MKKKITVYVVLTDYESDEWDYPSSEFQRFIGVVGSAKEARYIIEDHAFEEFYTEPNGENAFKKWIDDENKITMSHVAYTNGTGKHGTEISWYYVSKEIMVEVP